MINKHTQLIIVSMLVFVVLNILENIIHFNIGKHSEKEDFYNYLLNFPSYKDLFRIVVIMLIFGFLQGFLTDLFNGYADGKY